VSKNRLKGAKLPENIFTRPKEDVIFEASPDKNLVPDKAEEDFMFAGNMQERSGRTGSVKQIVNQYETIIKSKKDHERAVPDIDFLIER
jgi:hypothetical protein